MQVNQDGTTTVSYTGGAPGPVYLQASEASAPFQWTTIAVDYISADTSGTINSFVDDRLMYVREQAFYQQMELQYLEMELTMYDAWWNEGPAMTVEEFRAFYGDWRSIVTDIPAPPMMVYRLTQESP
jgi:hypothetical protein